MQSYHYLLISHQDSFARAILPYVVTQEERLSFADTPVAASALIRREKPDAVLVALEQDDHEAALHCRTLRHYSNAPIVMLVHNSPRDEVTRGYRLGADAHIELPCDPRIFRARLDAVLRRMQAMPGTQSRPIKRAAANSLVPPARKNE